MCQEGRSAKLPLTPMEPKKLSTGQSAVILVDGQWSRALAPASNPSPLSKKTLNNFPFFLTPDWLWKQGRNANKCIKESV